MKNKNLLVICVAAGLCIVSVFLLVGSMGAYAEKSGTVEFVPETSESETSDTLMEILSESSQESETVKEGPLSSMELQKIWEKMYGEYLAADYTDDESRRGDVEKFLADQNAGPDAIKNEEIYKDTYLSASPDSGLSAKETGLSILKEINRLYPEDGLDNLRIDTLNVDSDFGNDEGFYVEWVGALDNGYEMFDAEYISYNFHIDAASGKIMHFGKFHPYQKDKDYSGISWTDEEIKDHARELIQKYDLTEGEELDWSDIELYNGTDEIESLKKELEEEPESSVMVSNLIIFRKNNQRYFYFNVDWETGEICDYIWMGRSTPM